ncbi:MAG: cysteine-rich CWC family protein [Bacteroidia bacterium]
MEKICMNCNEPFECNMENITDCHCYSVKLSDENKLLIASKFEDCLCNKCLYLIIEKKEKI